MSDTPKSKLTQILADLHGCEIDGPEDCPAVQEALPQIVSLLRELVPDEEMLTPELNFSEGSVAFSNGWNACRNEMLKRLEGL